MRRRLDTTADRHTSKGRAKIETRRAVWFAFALLAFVFVVLTLLVFRGREYSGPAPIETGPTSRLVIGSPQLLEV